MGRKVEALKVALKNSGNGVEVEGKTVGEVLENYNLKTATVDLYISTGAVSDATVVLKKGSEIGSGESVAPSAGKYSVKYGEYNYSITKVGYTAATGVIAVTAADVKVGRKDVTIALTASV